MEEKKKRFIDPVIWAKRCCILILVGIGLVLYAITEILLEKFLGHKSLFFISLAVFNIPLLFIFFTCLLAIFIGSFVSLAGLLIIKEKRKKPYFHALIYALTPIVLGFLMFNLIDYMSNRSRIIIIEGECNYNMKNLSLFVLDTSESNDIYFDKNLWCDLTKDQTSTLSG
ncbi:MAG: hypothetical protein ACYTBW_02805 [Planctomycetota bacterium]|jgi:hypothetical protein